MLPDFTFINHGSLWICSWNNERAGEHLREHTNDETQFWGDGIVVEPRYVQSLADQLAQDGFTVG